MDQWKTYLLQFKGGLITDLSLLQQGINAPGSARILRNYEPSTEGGYRRILGYTKYDDAFVPPYGEPVVQGSGQTGTSLDIANIFVAPQPGDTLTIAGVTGTYTIAAGGVSYSSSGNSATLTLTTSLDSSPADQAAITFSNTSDLITGITYFNDNAIVQRNADLWESNGSGWTRINVPSYGTVLVDGGSQTGTSLTVDGITGTPKTGDTFTINGVELVYTITSDPTVSSGSATFAITPALDSSPSDNAVITFLGSDRGGNISRVRFAEYNFDGTENIVIVDGVNTPAFYDGTTFEVINSGPPTGVTGATSVVEFRNHLFFAKDSLINFTAPYKVEDFTVANGGGEFRVTADIKSLIVFRENLFIFGDSEIYRLQGFSASTFEVSPVTKDLGCIDGDTVQEIGGDVMFLAHDGLRLLSATDRIGDFGLAAITRPVQSTFIEFEKGSTSFTSCVIREKSQYRVFGYNSNLTDDAAKGFIAVQFGLQGPTDIQFAETRGINAYAATSKYDATAEIELFSNSDGYVYQMESGNDFDGSDITSTFATPYIPITDPRVRKGLYKAVLYINPEGSFNVELTPRLDFDNAGVIQPSAIAINNDTDTVAFYGSAVYGTSSYGGQLKLIFEEQLVGACFNVSFVFNGVNTDPPHILDAMTIEYNTNDRR